MTASLLNHTPGPWYHTASSPDGTVYSSHHQLIVPYPPDGATDHTHADARLIALAPDLLALIVRLAETPCDHGAQPFCPRAESLALLGRLEGRLAGTPEEGVSAEGARVGTILPTREGNTAVWDLDAMDAAALARQIEYWLTPRPGRTVITDASGEEAKP
jgi:hypothetical protein